MAKIRKTTSIKTAEEFACKIDAIACLEVELNVALAKQKETMQRLRVRYAERVKKKVDELARMMGDALCYGTINRSKMIAEGRKSAETALAIWGWRTSPASLSLAKGRNWADIIAAMSALDAPYCEMLIYTAPKPDKNRIKTEMPSALLAGLGLKVEPKEDFFVTPKDTTIEEL